MWTRSPRSQGPQGLKGDPGPDILTSTDPVTDFDILFDQDGAYFDGGQAALDALQAKRLEVKAKYPKN
jgi:hypothetical protein